MLLFIKEIFSNLIVGYLLILVCIGGSVCCYWLVFQSINDIRETYQRRERERELERKYGKQ